MKKILLICFLALSSLLVITSCSYSSFTNTYHIGVLRHSLRTDSKEKVNKYFKEKGCPNEVVIEGVNRGECNAKARKMFLQYISDISEKDVIEKCGLMENEFFEWAIYSYDSDGTGYEVESKMYNYPE